MKTWKELLEYGEETLRSAGIEDSSVDAWFLLSECFSINRTFFFLNKTKSILPAQVPGQIDRNDQTAGQQKERERRYLELLKKRAERYPLQYLIGTQEFMGLSFLVNESVLIPRADTETLVETVLQDCKKHAFTSVLDVCTGSGCIAIALAKLGSFQKVDACDLSKDALALAGKNAENLQAFVSFYEGDLLEPVEGRYDVIVSNPPYIPDCVIAGLEPEVKDHEPYMALSGGKDGLLFYRKLAAQAGAYLNPGGAVYFEIGYDQAEAVSGLLKENGFSEVRVIRDLSGNDRVAAGTWKGDL